MELNVDVEKWNVSKHGQPPRPQSLESKNIIQSTDKAQAWSQLLMVPNQMAIIVVVKTCAR